MELTSKIIIALAALSINSCTAAEIRDDYNTYPQHKNEIALYNISNIFNDYCGNQKEVNNKKIECEQQMVFYRWNEIISAKCKIGERGYYVQIIGKEYDSEFFTKKSNIYDGKKECEGLDKAINTYLSELKK